MCNIGKKVRVVGAAGQLPTADGLRHFAQCSSSDGDRPFEMDTCTLAHLHTVYYSAKMVALHPTTMVAL